MRALVAVIVRGLPPAMMLAAGICTFVYLRSGEEIRKPRRESEQVITTRVATLEVGSYQPVIESHGTVTAHNPVVLSAEVTGRVLEVTTRFDVGSYFKKDDLLLSIDDRDYQTALKVAEQNHRLALSKERLVFSAHERMKALVARNSGSETELDATLTALVEATAQVDITEASLEQAQRDLSRTKIIAPFDGRVVARAVGPGQLVSLGSPLGDIFATDYAEVRLPVSTSELAQLNLPQRQDDPPLPIELRDAIDSQNQAVWNAEIVRTDAALDTGSLQLFAIARINDPYSIDRDGPAIRVGQPVVASIKGKPFEQVVAIPREAVRRLDQVYLIDGKRLTLRRTTIDPIWTDSRHVVVPASEVRPGELVSTTTLVYAPEGEVVQIIDDGPQSDSALAGTPAVDPVP
ncbi:MAG: efflux RND transporter periplasmic adaptor subunit [Planctomycetota bacterium]